jgi:hypothetical protein
VRQPVRKQDHRRGRQGGAAAYAACGDAPVRQKRFSLHSLRNIRGFVIQPRLSGCESSDAGPEPGLKQPANGCLHRFVGRSEVADGVSPRSLKPALRIRLTSRTGVTAAADTSNASARGIATPRNPQLTLPETLV